MNDPKQRKKLLWALILGGALVFCLVFVSLFAPSAPSATNEPVLRVATDAATPAATVSAAASPSGSGFSLGGGQLVSLAWRLALVAVIIAISIVGLRWWARPRPQLSVPKVYPRHRTIHLVALGDRVIAIGATPQQLTFLNELSDDEARHVIDSLPQQADQPLSAFAAELFQSVRRTTTARSIPPTNHREAVIGDELSR
ncbi:MAG: flagellar biosynthetic protein FliO [Dehalococcoidia bacterium]|nr:flagellar biosynthetic protein FliO [Dehalococcoidia bacterium]